MRDIFPAAVDFMEKPLRLEILLDKIAVVLSNKPPDKITIKSFMVFLR